jgi:cytoskeletal protein CcmA (bactofilin family)
MKIVTKISTGLTAGLLLALMAILPASAQTPTPPTPVIIPTPAPFEDDRRILRGDRTISGENFTLRSGETLRGDLTVFGGDVMLEANSRVEGNVNIFGGSVVIAGIVTGDVSVVGSDAQILPTAKIQGDMVRVNSTVNRAAGAVVGGRETTMDVPFLPRATEPDRVVVSYRTGEERGPFGWFVSLMANAFIALIGVILITLFTLALVALLPSNVAQAASTATNYWLMSGAVGALTIVAVPIVALILAVTICLIPIALVLLLIYGVAILAGWAISARIVGERVMRALNRGDWTPLGQALAGAVLLALLGTAPIIGSIVGFIAAALGLGALILTRAGTQPYVPQSMPAGVSAAPSVAPSVAPQPAPPEAPPSTPDRTEPPASQDKSPSE